MFYVYIGVTMWYLILYIVSSLAWPDQQESFPLAPHSLRQLTAVLPWPAPHRSSPCYSTSTCARLTVSETTPPGTPSPTSSRLSQPPRSRGTGQQRQPKEYPHPGVPRWAQHNSTPWPTERIWPESCSRPSTWPPCTVSRPCSTAPAVPPVFQRPATVWTYLATSQPLSKRSSTTPGTTTFEREIVRDRGWTGEPWHHGGAVLHCPGFLRAGDYHHHCLRADWRLGNHRCPEVQKNQQLDHEYEADIQKMRWDGLPRS